MRIDCEVGDLRKGVHMLLASCQMALTLGILSLNALA